MSDPLELDQDDFVARLFADTVLAEAAILEQRRGLTEGDVETALQTLNVRGGKYGAVIIVLMPTLVPLDPDAPGPEYRVRASIQIIEQPDLNRATGGTLLTAEQIAGRIRPLFHHYQGGRGTWTFAGMEPLTQDSDRVSYALDFTRLARDASDRSATPLITPESGAAPQSVTLEAGAGAAIYYTLDGSYPWSGNAEATLYTGAIAVDDPATLRAVATETSKLPSNAAETAYT